jgi:hypothetical protein
VRRAPAGARRTREIGEFTLLALAGYGGYATTPYGGGDTRGAVAGASASLAFRVRRLTFGPEIGGLAGESGVVSTRWNPVLQYSTSGPHPVLFTVGAGRRFSW